MQHEFEDMRRAVDQSVGQQLLKAARLLDELALRRLRALPGAPPVRPAHTRLLPWLGPDGVRPTDLARHLGVTKQAVAPLLQDLIDWGVVVLTPDPADRRARLARLTPEGARAVFHGLGLLRDLEREVEGALGPERWSAAADGIRAFAETLTALDAATSPAT